MRSALASITSVRCRSVLRRGPARPVSRNGSRPKWPPKGPNQASSSRQRRRWGGACSRASAKIEVAGLPPSSTSSPCSSCARSHRIRRASSCSRGGRGQAAAERIRRRTALESAPSSSPIQARPSKLWSPSTSAAVSCRPATASPISARMRSAAAASSRRRISAAAPSSRSVSPGGLVRACSRYQLASGRPSSWASSRPMTCRSARSAKVRTAGSGWRASACRRRAPSSVSTWPSWASTAGSSVSTVVGAASGLRAVLASAGGALPISSNERLVSLRRGAEFRLQRGHHPCRRGQGQVAGQDAQQARLPGHPGRQRWCVADDGRGQIKGGAQVLRGRATAGAAGGILENQEGLRLRAGFDGSPPQDLQQALLGGGGARARRRIVPRRVLECEEEGKRSEAGHHRILDGGQPGTAPPPLTPSPGDG